MALFVVRVEDRKCVRQWFSDTQERSKEDSVLRNPLKWRLNSIKQGKSLLLVCDVEPVFFNFSVFGWVSGVAVFLIWGYHWVLWPCVIIGMMTYFWTADFFFQMTKLALRKKAKYSGPVKRVKLAELIREVVL